MSRFTKVKGGQGTEPNADAATTGKSSESWCSSNDRAELKHPALSRERSAQVCNQGNGGNISAEISGGALEPPVHVVSLSVAQIPQFDKDQQ